MHLLVVGIVASTGGCEDRASTTKPIMANPVSFTTLRFEPSSTWRHHAQAHYVVRNELEWQRMWRRGHYSMQVGVPPTPPAPPPVDFKSEMIIAVFQGRFPTGGYGIQIIEVGETDGQLTVVVEYHERGGMQDVTQAVTYPAHLVSVPQSDKPVGFRIVEINGSQ